MDHTLKLLQNFLLSLTQGELVGNLIQMTYSLCPLAIYPSDGKAYLLQSIDYAPDMSGYGHRRHMEHYRCSQSCSGICWTSRQISVLSIKGIIQFILKSVVNLGAKSPPFSECQARQKSLKPDVILLVDHYSYFFIVSYGKATLLRLLNQHGTDQMFLHKSHSFPGFQGRHFKMPEAALFKGSVDSIPHYFKNLSCLLLVSIYWKWVIS